MRFVLLVFIVIIGFSSKAQIRTAHVYVALCDNEHQGIVSVPVTLGNGKDPARNLYWPAIACDTSLRKYKKREPILFCGQPI